MKRQLFEAIDLGGGQIEFNAIEPVNVNDMELLTLACARLMAKVALESGDKLVCHSGCTFAAMIDVAHKAFCDGNEKEYERIVEVGLLTKSTITQRQH